MPTYRNVGSSPWRRPSNCKAVAPGAKFEATEREHEALQRRPWMRKRIVLLDPTPRAEDTDDEVPTKDEAPPNDETTTKDEEPTKDEVTQDEDTDDEVPTKDEAPTPDDDVVWDLSTSPERYLELYPQGPRAALAQQLVEGQTSAPKE